MGAKLPGKKVCVLGLGVSGAASAEFLRRQGYEVWGSDGGVSQAVIERLEGLRELGIQGEVGAHSLESILACDWILISPGIPPFAPIYREIQKSGLPILSEIEVASRFFPSERVIAVTGTCGKTTMATLLARLLNSAGMKAVACGNIGNPWISELETLGGEGYAILELSSFQLEHCESFRPSIGILLNLSPNHEDWHEDSAAYTRAKLRLFQAQESGDFALVRPVDERTYFPQHSFAGKVLYFGETPDANPQAEVLGAVASILKIQEPHAQDTLRRFEGIEHRLEAFQKTDGVIYVNDSKSTTTSSLAWALNKYPDHSVILIAGGHPKSKDFGDIRDLLARKVKRAVLVGEAKALLRESWQGACALEDSENFEDAVRRACAKAVNGNVVLLSPACASFDMFKNYEERGKFFKSLVSKFTIESSSHVQSR